MYVCIFKTHSINTLIHCFTIIENNLLRFIIHIIRTHRLGIGTVFYRNLRSPYYGTTQSHIY